MQRTKHYMQLLFGVGVVIMACCLAAWVILTIMPTSEEPVRPERVLPLPTQTVSQSTEVRKQSTKTAKPTVARPPIIEAPITTIRIPAIGVDAKASGPIRPAKTARCKDSEQCMDPPLLDKIAWSDGFGLPSYPSKDAVLVYGHSNASSQNDQVFNNLGALVPNDLVILTTTEGSFTYTVVRVEQISFADIPWRQSLYTHTGGELRLFTCNLSGGGYDKAAVVTAQLIEAKPLR